MCGLFDFLKLIMLQLSILVERASCLVKWHGKLWRISPKRCQLFSQLNAVYVLRPSKARTGDDKTETFTLILTETLVRSKRFLCALWDSHALWAIFMRSRGIFCAMGDSCAL